MHVGFIGLGAMGSAMARNLAKAGHQVHAWNRSGDPGIEGVAIAPDSAAAFDSEVVFTMLSDDPAIREVLLESGVTGKAKPGLVHVVTSTISVAFAGELARAHELAGIGYVSAPVLGRPDVAAKGELNILAAASERQSRLCGPYWTCSARKFGTWARSRRVRTPRRLPLT